MKFFVLGIVQSWLLSHGAVRKRVHQANFIYIDPIWAKCEWLMDTQSKFSYRGGFTQWPHENNGLYKSELDKSVDLSLCGLAPAQSQMDFYIYIYSLWAGGRAKQIKGPPILTNQKKPCHAWLLLSCYFSGTWQFIVAGTGFLKIDSICDCAGEPTHAITTILSNLLLV